MRITNKIIQNNSLTNINRNKALEDKLNTMMSTEKKITRPSDDPVIAIRALRLHTNLTKANQYYERNVEDARAWLKITQDAVGNTVDVISDMYEQCVAGSKDSLKPDDRTKILESLKSLRDEIYATGNSDYAGRYVFSGYRTDTTLTFKGSTTKNYRITEQLSTEALQDITYVDSKDLNTITSANAATLTTTERDIETSQVHRLRLAYANCSDGALPAISYYDSTGAQQTITVDAADVVSVYSTSPNPYLAAEDSANGVVFIPETGELILSDAVYNTLLGLKDVGSTQTIDEGEIRITYEKSQWSNNELRPEHYYACTSTDDGIQYNEDFLTNLPTDTDGQIISYDMGMNQTLRVNTVANDVYTPDVGRDVDDLITITEQVVEMDEIKTKLETMVKNETDTAKKAQLEEKLTAVNKAFSLMADKMQKMFENGINRMQGYLDVANLALTQVGSRGARLDLIENRLSSQVTTFETLTSENENEDAEIIAVQLASAQFSYEAALMATGKITQTTLLNYL
ncbi:MAG: flagellar hook-associated protein FlgL [Roseburia sp.]|nr:flagellar hook-associated protein FlgL [Roseburia sp.]MCM1278424.1 flagellar hook-associated protein FlgL [Robinsoniella sp.]